MIGALMATSPYKAIFFIIQEKVYRELHPEQRKAEGKRRYEKIKHILSEKHLCGCGMEYTYQHKKRHEKSQKHQDWLKQQEE